MDVTNEEDFIDLEEEGLDVTKEDDLAELEEGLDVTVEDDLTG